ncbi:glycoside hydrolase family protein [Aestuariibaculum sediminum]|uniref:Glycoside hydrolase family 88 protein n=1 Tax=Aestuariibaculum sediminum TaxID=2770637 RepID=A0A8J6Q233_9FLAO|nr:glycoside hydrolase family 88 protein [Aestuariibaculum sediminum]MBD0831641.1 glycoside hydrolase family 88 protein [Aestuariibaculum sediminum]
MKFNQTKLAVKKIKENKRKLLGAYVIGVILFCFSCKELKANNEIGLASAKELDTFNLESLIADCETQLEISVPKLTDLSKHPRLIETGKKEWKEVPNNRLVWTSGFYPGVLWYMYDISQNEKWKLEAIKRTEVFDSFKTITEHHDIGFMMFPAFGKGYELGGKKEYKDILLTSAGSLASRFNPQVGTIRSWSNKMHPRWKQHITIIDNMLNLELLFWAAKHGGDTKFYDIAVKHAETTMKNHFREDYTSWHVLEYDSITGAVLNRHTKQGYADNSRWSRGQAWGVYGYTMVYKETRDKKFLEFAQKITDKYLSLLPDDYVPCWDFDVANNPKEEKDASAAAVVASALLDLSEFVDNKKDQERYYDAALKMLESLGSDKYSGVGKTDSFLLHSTGAKSLGHEINVALIYADYYYIEALDRLKKIREKGKL